MIASLYALRALRTASIARWAVGRALASLGLLVPLVTRALPMLLLFVTFFFINTEVWQVATPSTWGVLGGTVLFFGLAAVFFLVARLGEELDVVDDIVSTEQVVAGCAGTPLESAARDLAARRTDLAVDSQVVGLEKANLVLALVIAQAVQVLLLSVAVSLFFMVFGSVAIEDEVIVSWIGEVPDYPLRRRLRQRPAGQGLDLPRLVQRPLLHGLRRHRRDVPPAVLHRDPARARAGGRRSGGLPPPARRARRATPATG